jgi:hypothetical protein
MADDVAPPPYDATDIVAENNARRDAERWAREDADVLRAIMHTKKGRAFIIRQLDRCYVNSPDKFVLGAPDATAHNLGRESYGILLLQDVMAASTDLYMVAIKEQQEERRRATEVRRSERKRREEESEPKQQALSDLPPPKGFPGHVPPAPPPKKK